ncbi:putative F-box protein [Cardamine amara subsp. amara]|uniref:F-box protein n=1 Tax=Cardamine amara subsp. amara TaxID=228776 RepID=A0ABD1AXJ3_CARAN
MESQEESGNVPRWEKMDKDILSNIFKKLDVVDVIMGASRVCVTWFLASHNRTIWSTIKLNDLDSIFLDNPYGKTMQDNDRVKRRYHLRKILIEINKFGRTAPINIFFNVYCNIIEEDLAILYNGMPNIIKLALPMWTTLNLNSIQSAFSKWKNLQTLILGAFKSQGDTLSLELQAIGDNCRDLTNMKFLSVLKEDLPNIIVCNFPSLERLSFRCCTEASTTLINGLPNLKILNLSHCIFMKPSGIGESHYRLGMKPYKLEIRSLTNLWCVVRTAQFAKMYGNIRMIVSVKSSIFATLGRSGGKLMRLRN